MEIDSHVTLRGIRYPDTSFRGVCRRTILILASALDVRAAAARRRHKESARRRRRR